MLNAALIGAWHVHFGQHADEFASRNDCRISALWDDDPVRGKTCAAKYGCDFEPDYDAVLARPDVDAVIVNSATNQHTELLLKAARAGKHIFTEKVLCLTVEDALALKKAVEQSGVKFCIAFFWRSHGDMQTVKSLLEQGALGEVTYARMRNPHDGAIAGWLPEHFYDPVQCGGGAMIDLGTHPMYLLAWLLGMPKAVSSVFTSVTGHAVEDNAVSVLEYENGAIAVSETSFVACQGPASLEICGTKGSLCLGGAHGGLVVNTGEGWKAPEIPADQKIPMDFWVDGILTGSEIPYGIDDAVNLTLLMDAAYRSHREGKKAFLK